MLSNNIKKAHIKQGHISVKKFFSIALAVMFIFTMVSSLVTPASAVAPTVTADGWPTVTISSASLYGYINANQGINIRQSGFQYKLASSSTWITCYTKSPINADDREIRYTLTGLQSGTTYNYRAFATNVNSEQGFSPTVTFTTTKPVTYTITYNANGGSGAPAAQTKTQNVALTLSTTKPTRSGYEFLGWATTSTATTATYQSGASYTANAGTTLYAVWKTNLREPIEGYRYINTQSAPLNLRSDKSTTSSVLTTIPRATRIYVEYCEMGDGVRWAKTSYSGYSGYVDSAYLSLNQPQAIGNLASMDVYINNAAGSVAKEWGAGTGTQCVELPKHYIETVWGFATKTLPLGNGRDMYYTVPQKYPNQFERINYYNGFVPKKGDIISLRGSDDAKEYGHAAIVKSVSIVDKSISVTILEQWKDSSTVRERTFTITGNVASTNSASPNDIYGVARPK
jgi:hypothetical protein